MNQTELIEQTAEALDISDAHAERLLKATVQEIRDLLVNGEAVTIPHLGTFDTVIHEPRRGFLPAAFSAQGPGYALFPTRRVPVFRAGKWLHDSVYSVTEPETPVLS